MRRCRRCGETFYGPFGLAGLEPGSVDEIDTGDLAEFRRTLK